MPSAKNGNHAHNQNSKQCHRPTRPSCLAKCRRVRQHAIDSYRIGNVLDLAVAQRLIGAHQFILDLLVDPPEIKRSPGVAIPSRRAAMFTPSPKTPSGSTITSPR